MPKAEIAKAVQLLDLALEFFGDDRHWIRGAYDDGNGGHCLVGALLHLGRKHGLPVAPATALLQDAMPRPGLPLVHFNDRRCGSVAELRSVILKARRLVHEDAEREQAAAAAKTWLLAEIEKKRRARPISRIMRQTHYQSSSIGDGARRRSAACATKPAGTDSPQSERWFHRSRAVPALEGSATGRVKGCFFHGWKIPGGIDSMR